MISAFSSLSDHRLVFIDNAKECQDVVRLELGETSALQVFQIPLGEQGMPRFAIAVFAQLRGTQVEIAEMQIITIRLSARLRLLMTH